MAQNSLPLSRTFIFSQFVSPKKKLKAWTVQFKTGHLATISRVVPCRSGSSLRSAVLPLPHVPRELVAYAGCTAAGNLQPQSLSQPGTPCLNPSRLAPCLLPTTR